MDSTRLVRVGGCLLAGSLLVSLALHTAQPASSEPVPILLLTVLGWLIQASLVLGSVTLVAGLVLRELGLLPRPEPADLEPAIDHFG